MNRGGGGERAGRGGKKLREGERRRDACRLGGEGAHMSRRTGGAWGGGGGRSGGGRTG